MNTQVIESSDLVGQRNLRIEKLEKLKKLGINPYPAVSKKDMPNGQVTTDFDSLTSGFLSSTRVSLSLTAFSIIAL